MKTFSIADLAQYTMIKAHTFRTWEQRFEIFKTNRKNTNIRYYTLEDLSFFLDFALLNRLGYKVSHLVQLDKDAIRQKVSELTEDKARQEHAINRLIISAFSLNVEEFESTLDHAVSLWNIEETIETIILPFIERIKLFSYKRCTSYEYHFVVTALRKKIILGIEQVTPRETFSKSALLFLPQGEHYDLLLLYMNYRLKKAGLKTLYLGTDISSENLRSVILKKNPEFLVTYHAALRGQIDNSFQDYLFKADRKTFFLVGTPPILETEQQIANIMTMSYRQVYERMLALAN